MFLAILRLLHDTALFLENTKYQHVLMIERLVTMYHNASYFAITLQNGNN